MMPKVPKETFKNNDHLYEGKFFKIRHLQQSYRINGYWDDDEIDCEE